MRVWKNTYGCLILPVLLAPLWLGAGSIELPAPPPLPGYVSGVLSLDPGRAQAMAEAYRLKKGDQASAEDFMFACLPTEIFTGILNGAAPEKNLPGDLGLLYWSGFDGGIWLNHIMKSDQGGGIGPAGLLRAIRSPVLHYLAAKCRKRIKLIETGTGAQKLQNLDRAFDLLAQSYGYNRGYLEEILKHPPAGSQVDPAFFSCGEFLDCRYSGVDLAPMQGLMPVREKLAHPPAPNWEPISARIAGELRVSQARGAGVWKNILSKPEFSPESYSSLLEISAEFLVINEAVMLASAQALADQDPEAAGRALAADTALKVWLAGYLLGLAEGGK